MFRWKHATVFSERVDRLGLHGRHFQHVALCRRRAWMLLHHIHFAQWNERVARGLALHHTHHLRDRSVLGLQGLYPDRIDWERRLVYEHKGGAGAAQAVADQAGFYALMLTLATGEPWEARVRILPGPRERRIPLDEERLDRLRASSGALEALAAQPEIPAAQRLPLCHTCSLVTFCGFD